MNYFDCHCDTLTLMDPARDTLYSNSLFIDLKRVSAFADRYTQIYAIFDDVAESPEGSRDARFEQLYDQARAYLAAQEDRIALVTSAAEMHAAHAEGRAAAFLSIEDVSVMGSHVEELYDRGFRFCMLAWNHDNVYACGADFDQRRGITQRGRDLVRELLAQGVVMDISHLSDAGAEDLFSMTDAPIMASHSDVRAVCNMARNLERWQIDELIRRRGLIGLNFYRYFIGGDYTLDALLRHADAILESGGEDVLALGGDIDGCYGDHPVGFEGIQSMPDVRAAFVSAFGEELAEKIFYANAEAFIDRVL